MARLPDKPHRAAATGQCTRNPQCRGYRHRRAAGSLPPSLGHRKPSPHATSYPTPSPLTQGRQSDQWGYPLRPSGHPPQRPSRYDLPLATTSPPARPEGPLGGSSFPPYASPYRRKRLPSPRRHRWTSTLDATHVRTPPPYLPHVRRWAGGHWGGGAGGNSFGTPFPALPALCLRCNPTTPSFRHEKRPQHPELDAGNTPRRPAKTLHDPALPDLLAN